MINVTFEIKGEKPDLTNVLERVYTKYFNYEEITENVSHLHVVLISWDSLRKLKKNLSSKRHRKTKIRITQLRKNDNEFGIYDGR